MADDCNKTKNYAPLAHTLRQLNALSSTNEGTRQQLWSVAIDQFLTQQQHPSSGPFHNQLLEQLEQDSLVSRAYAERERTTSACWSLEEGETSDDIHDWEDEEAGAYFYLHHVTTRALEALRCFTTCLPRIGFRLRQVCGGSSIRRRQPVSRSGWTRQRMNVSTFLKCWVVAGFLFFGGMVLLYAQLLTGLSSRGTYGFGGAGPPLAMAASELEHMVHALEKKVSPYDRQETDLTYTQLKNQVSRVAALLKQEQRETNYYKNQYAQLVQHQQNGSGGNLSSNNIKVTAPQNSELLTNGSQRPVKSDFVYVYAVGGVDPDQPHTYRYSLFDILISTHLQRQDGSKADVVVFIQLHHQSKWETLSPEEGGWLQALNIHVIYLQKPPDASLSRFQLEKFRMLEMTEYRRVMFLSTDIMVRNSLDYLFELSVQGGTLQENVVLRGRSEPANGAIFLLTPHAGDYQRLRDIVRTTQDRRKGKSSEWDKKRGWGHFIEKDDPWVLLSGTNGTHWTFHGHFADQGLLYHWIKYEKESVSIITRDGVEQWVAGSTGGRQRLVETVSLHIFDKYSNHNFCWKGTIAFRKCMSPHSDFVQYVGREKPWFQGFPKQSLSNTTAYKTPQNFWFYRLGILNDKLHIGLDFQDWKAERSLLGLVLKDDVFG